MSLSFIKNVIDDNKDDSKCKVKTIVIPVIVGHNWNNLKIVQKILTYLLHGAESFLRSYLVLQLSRNSPHFWNL